MIFLSFQVFFYVVAVEDDGVTVKVGVGAVRVAGRTRHPTVEPICDVVGGEVSWKEGEIWILSPFS